MHTKTLTQQNGSLVKVREHNISEPNGSLESFKKGVDELLIKRDYFIKQVLPQLKENQDFYIIKGKKSLAKGGAEKLASIYRLTATFSKDTEALEMLGNIKGVVAFKCDLLSNNSTVGQGRGASSLESNNNDANKTIKMAAKSSFIDAVIRTTGLSCIFTQDLENMDANSVIDYGREEKAAELEDNNETEEQLATDKQKDYLRHLIDRRSYGSTENYDLENLTKSEASRMINALITGHSVY